MANLILPSNRVQQPVGVPELKSEYYDLFTSLTLPGDTLAAGYDLVNWQRKPFSSSGTVSNRVPTPFGRAVVGNGTTGVLSRSVSVTPQAMWMVVSFVPTVISTTQKCLYALGTNATSLGGYFGISSGGNSSNNITAQFRGIDGGSVISKIGPLPVLGKQTTVVFVCPSNLNSAARIYVNGVEYNTDSADAANATFTTTLVHEAVCALKRGTTAVYSPDKILLAGYGLGQIQPVIARELSINPWQIFVPKKKVVYFDLGTSGISTGLSGISSFLNAGSLSNSKDLPLFTSIIDSFLGSLTASSASEIVANLAGQAAGVSAGSFSTTTSKTLEPLVINTSTWFLSSSLNKNLTDVSINTSSGSLAYSVNKSLQPSIISVIPGFVTIYDGSLIRVLTGQQASLEQGDITLSLSKNLSGQLSAVSLGFIVGAVSKSLAGSVSIINQGSLSLSISKRVDGSLVLSGQGSILFADADIALGLNGETILSYQGNLITLGKVETPVTKVIVYGTEYNLLSINNPVNIISIN